MAARMRRHHLQRSEVVNDSKWRPFVVNDRRSPIVTVAATPAPDDERVNVISFSGRRYSMLVTSLLDGYQLVNDETPVAEEAPASVVLGRPEAPTEGRDTLDRIPSSYVDDVPAPAEPIAAEPEPPPAAPELEAVDMVVRDVDGWMLGYQGDEDEPLIRDVDLGERLGLGRPRDVRPLIERLEKSGKIAGVHVRDTVSRTSMPRGGERAAVVREVWLTEEQALLVVTASETPKAIALTREIVRVFIAARRGMLPAPPAAPPANDARVDRLVGAVEALVGLVSTMVQFGALGRAEVPPVAAPAPAPVVPPPPPSRTQRVLMPVPKGWMGARDIALVLTGRLHFNVSEDRVNKAIKATGIRNRDNDIVRRIITSRVDERGDKHEHPKWIYSSAVLPELEGVVRAGRTGSLFEKKRG